MRQHARPGITLRVVLMASASLFVAGAAYSQSPAPARIGYVDMKRLLDNAPQVSAGRQKLEREFGERDAALRVDEKRASELRERKTRTTGPEADSMQREIDALDRSIKRSRDGLRAELKTRSDQELDKSWREISDAVVEFAREQGFDLIVPSPVIYASARVDVTDQVLERLRRQAPARATP